MSYFKRGKNNRFDAYMAGISIWLSPRQIILLSEILNNISLEERDDVSKEAILDFKLQIDHEAEIKKEKYL